MGRLILRSIDTNILVRLLVRDDPDQLAAAEALLGQYELFIPLSVLMETEWVLRGAYGYGREEIGDRLAEISRVKNIVVEAPDVLDWLFDRYRAGADLADMIHLIQSEGMECLVTFDRKLAGQAGPHAPLPVETLDA